jgi:hypothetical protein
MHESYHISIIYKYNIYDIFHTCMRPKSLFQCEKSLLKVLSQGGFEQTNNLKTP